MGLPFRCSLLFRNRNLQSQQWRVGKKLSRQFSLPSSSLRSCSLRTCRNGQALAKSPVVLSSPYLLWWRVGNTLVQMLCHSTNQPIRDVSFFIAAVYKNENPWSAAKSSRINSRVDQISNKCHYRVINCRLQYSSQDDIRNRRGLGSRGRYTHIYIFFSLFLSLLKINLKKYYSDNLARLPTIADNNTIAGNVTAIWVLILINMTTIR